MKFALARKIGMARIFDAEGKQVAVSKALILASKVSQIKTVAKDGYQSVQITAFKDEGKKTRNIRVREFKTDQVDGLKRNDKMETTIKAGDIVDVTGTSKGKGFAGTIKRHGFKRGPESHGGNNVREPGSIGAQQPQRVVLGRKMAGHMGVKTATIKNLQVVAVMDDIILISGAIPGPNKGIIEIVAKNADEAVAEPEVTEEVVEEEATVEEISAE